MSGPHSATPSALFLLVLVSESWSFYKSPTKAPAFTHKDQKSWPSVALQPLTSRLFSLSPIPHTHTPLRQDVPLHFGDNL